MKVIVFLVMILLSELSKALPLDKDAIIFIEEEKPDDKDAIITPPVLPVIEHLERDPTTFRKEDNEVLPRSKNLQSEKVSPRFGFTGSFGVTSNNDGFSASLSHGFTGAGANSQSASQSFNVGGLNQGGFQASQSSSQASSFGGNQGFLGPSLSGSQASSQSSSISAGLNGLQSSSAGSSAGSSSGNVFGNGFSSSNAQSSANSFGVNGIFSPNGQFNQNNQGQPNNGFRPSGVGFMGGAANSQSSAGSFQNRLPIPNRPPPTAQGQNFFGPSGGSFTSSGANSQSLGRPYRPNRPTQNFFSPSVDERGRGFDSPIVFPGPTNIKQRAPSSNPFLTGLVPPNQNRNQQFRAIRRKPSTYQVIRIEV